VTKELERLKNTVQTQSMSVAQVLEIKTKSDYLKKEIKYSEAELEDNKKVVERYDEQISEKRETVIDTIFSCIALHLHS